MEDITERAREALGWNLRGGRLYLFDNVRDIKENAGTIRNPDINPPRLHMGLIFEAYLREPVIRTTEEGREYCFEIFDATGSIGGSYSTTVVYSLEGTPRLQEAVRVEREVENIKNANALKQFMLIFVPLEGLPLKVTQIEPMDDEDNSAEESSPTPSRPEKLEPILTG